VERKGKVTTRQVGRGKRDRYQENEKKKFFSSNCGETHVCILFDVQPNTFDVRLADSIEGSSVGIGIVL
jgi:hypothetical protein